MKSIFKLLLMAALISITASCKTLGLNYERPATTLPEKYAEEDINASVQAPNAWWTLYQDAQLTSLVEKAFKQNTNIQLAVARIEEADAQMREVGAALLPTVDLQGSSERNRVTEKGAFPPFGSNPRNNNILKLNSSIELDFWGKISRAKEAARANYLSTQYAKDTVLWSLSSLVANHYFIIRSVDSQLIVNQENQKISEESLALTKRRLAGGIVSILDVHQAELALTNLQSQALELMRLRALSEHQLGLLTGELNLTVNHADLLALPIPPSPPAGMPSQLMESRPDVRQTEQALVAANANIGLAKAALYPSVSLTGALGGESVALSDILKSAARIWNFAVLLDLPIFNAGKLNSRVDQASAKQKQALANYQTAIQNAFTEVNDALVNVRQYKEIESIANRKQETSNKILQVAQNRYKAGYSAYIEVLDAQRSHQEATQAFVQSQQNTLIATVALFKALGGGWQAPTIAPTTSPTK